MTSQQKEKNVIYTYMIPAKKTVIEYFFNAKNSSRERTQLIKKMIVSPCYWKNVSFPKRWECFIWTERCQFQQMKSLQKSIFIKNACRILSRNLPSAITKIAWIHENWIYILSFKEVIIYLLCMYIFKGLHKYKARDFGLAPPPPK